MVRPARVFRRYRAVRSIPAQTPRPTSSRRANLVAVGALVASTAFTGRPAAAEPAPVRAQSLMGSARQVAVARQFPAWWAPVMAQRATGAAQPDGPATYLLDLPAGALDATLAAFERETRIRVDAGRIPADTLSMMQSPGVRGELTGDAALTALLTGTGLGF